MNMLRTMRRPARPDKGATKAQPITLNPLSTEQALGALLQIPSSALRERASKPTRASRKKKH
jgi:hypothetical protein